MVNTAPLWQLTITEDAMGQSLSGIGIVYAILPICFVAGCRFTTTCAASLAQKRKLQPALQACCAACYQALQQAAPSTLSCGAPRQN